MVQHFNPRNVLRHLPADLVRQFCDKHGVPLAVTWQPEPSPTEVFEAFQNLPSEASAEFEQMLTQVHQLGTPLGVAHLHEEAAYRNKPFDDPDPEYGPPAVALWCLLHRGGVFHHVRMLDAADRLPGRYWHKVTGLPAGPPDLSPTARQQIRQALADYLRTEQGRGRQVSVEYHTRAGREHYLFC